MWVVRLALRRPYTFVVGALLVVLLSTVTVMRMAIDIFPDIDIPVVNVLWTYAGMTAEEMEKRIVQQSERAFTATVNDIEHLESQSFPGVGLIKVFFRPGADVAGAVAQLNATTGTVLRFMPPGINPPFIIRYSASSVPVLMMSMGSETLSEQEVYDLGFNVIRIQLATVQGASIPLPYGGKPRQIMVDLDPQALLAKGLSPADVTQALNNQSLFLPAGSAKIGAREYSVTLNSSPDVVGDMNDIPIRDVRGAMVYLRDVAQVHDGFSVQTNVVRQDGRRGSFLLVQKRGGASTLDIIKKVKAALPKIQAGLPPELSLKTLFDQSFFVKASLFSVLKEGLAAALLTALVLLLFLGSWRSTVIVAISIPLSILCSVLLLRATGETLNIMTLGGLALAVGILVDDATVEIENIHRNFSRTTSIDQAILDGAQQIALPAFVSTLAICVVFVPVFFITGVARSLFVPLAKSVVFAMLASYVISRTLVPTMVKYLLPGEMHGASPAGATVPKVGGVFHRIHEAFLARFEAFHQSYAGLLAYCLAHRRRVLTAAGAVAVISFALVPFIGQDFFPSADSGEFRLHVRAPAGTRIEETERWFERVEQAIRELIPESELSLTLDNMGLPAGGLNLGFADTANTSSADGEILVALNRESGASAERYVRTLRRELPGRFPELSFFFQPSDIVSQTLNFGLPAPIDIQVAGRAREENYKLAREIERAVRQVPGAVDVHLHQVVDAPELHVDVDRDRAILAGLSQRDVASDVLYALSGSAQSVPNLWLNHKSGISYAVSVQTPPHRIDTLDALGATPVTSKVGGSQLLTNLASVKRRTTTAVASHYNAQPVFDVYANVDGRDLGGVARDVDRVLAGFRGKLPKGSTLSVRGQVESMRSSMKGLAWGLVLAALLVYFLMVVNFQSWLDPFIILTALPGAISGILLLLFATQTTFSVPSLMGAIMTVGVATANAILLVTFANQERMLGKNAFQAALSAGTTRLRPVLMTASAIVIGMVPMALGWGEGGEANAPLGRAVIGGVAVATVATLLFVPVVYSLLRQKQPSLRPILQGLSVGKT